jgi:NAD(P)-dependent dehydrogenase (short-subunit alcohol dehydrogenase family)
MLPGEMSLKDRVAVVGGLGQSWQKEIASYLAEAGADVAVFGKDKDEMAAAVRAVEKLGRQAMAITADVTSTREVSNMVKTVLKKWQKIDILVNSFNLPFAKPLPEISTAEWTKVIEANLTPVFVSTQVVGKHMLERKQGKVVTITSGLAERGIPNGTAYCASKGAVVQFTRALALEWARSNVRVNAIALGWMEDSAETANPEWRDALVRYAPLKRLARPEDFAAALVYLASDASSFVTGSTFYITGGLMAHG